ncbi:TolC family protein [Amorphus orientalis]|uniref:Protein CyaE n=1 Tax=Amorphus orientalis TaxID=649198 RepID=A0AAE3VS54_9HYPH|nr:TolC family protein [Amorphus orientalis]MDQ0317389.1 outer membrane protein TolC [Amorphus orientalis]
MAVNRSPTSRSSARRRVILLLGVALALGGCADNALKLAPKSPSEPWTPASDNRSALLPEGQGADTAGSAESDFRPPSDPAAAVLEPPPQLVAGRTYDLPELIDIAARNNPRTRIAWEEARQAALAVGMTEATFLPTLTATVIGGAQQVRTPLPDNITGIDSFTTTVDGVVPALLVEWLVFDFGQRRANAEAARHNSFAANVSFTGAHQQVIYEVAVAYYRYGATIAQERAAHQALRNSRLIQNAADSRNDRGLGTSVEVAQARQQVAQSKLRLVEAQGARRDAYQGLLAAMGVSPMTEIKVGDVAGRTLPRSVGQPTEQMIKAALAQRPDVLAAYSRLQASEAGIRAAEAEFRPKVYLSGIAAQDQADFSVGGLPGVGQQSTSAGVLVGMAIPIYSGGLRRAQLEEAKSLSQSAKEVFTQTQDAAAREIVIASDTLRTALEAHAAARELTAAADVTYDAALESYRSGVGTITDATAADTGLLDARQAQADAHAAALVAASTLAFSLGKMTSQDAPARAAGR